jgi:hypothetical protein
VAKFAATDVYVLVNGANISDWCFAVDAPDAKEQIDVSGFNPTGSKEFVPGTRTQSIVLSIEQDFSNATAIHGLLNPLYVNTTVFAVELRPTSGARSSTNPWYGGSAQLYEYDGLNAQLNSRAEITATILPASNAVWAWATV